MVIRLVLLLCFACPSVWACTYNAMAYPNSLTKFVESAEGIYLATLSKSQKVGDNNSYSFHVDEVLKGEPKHQLLIEVNNALPGALKLDIRHDVLRFWLDKQYGAVNVDSDCKIRPSFNLGYQYILVLSENATVKSYEFVASVDNKWLKFVRNQLNNIQKPLFLESEFFNGLNGIDLYTCKIEREDYSLRNPKYLRTVWGAKDKGMWPEKMSSLCVERDKQYVQLNFEDGYTTHILFDRGEIDLMPLFPNMEILKGNRLKVE